MVVFARQDLAQDPPFLRLDLISCRNVLIYFQTDLQAKILSMFHYALRPEGYLFLGRSENIFQQETLFRNLDKEAKLFLRENVLNRPPFTGGAFTLPPPEKASPAAAVSAAKSSEVQYLDAASRFYLPPGVLVNGNFEILHLYGSPGEYLNFRRQAEFRSVAHDPGRIRRRSANPGASSPAQEDFRLRPSALAEAG
jgi:two-component system CheB/CheR fusion protein